MGVRGQPLCCQCRYGRRTACCDCGSIQNQFALAGGDIKHHHVALDGRQGASRVGGCEGDQLGDGNRAVEGGHDKQAAATRQRLHKAGWYLYGFVSQQSIDTLNQCLPGKAGGGLVGIEETCSGRIHRDGAG